MEKEVYIVGLVAIAAMFVLVFLTPNDGSFIETVGSTVFKPKARDLGLALTLSPTGPVAPTDTVQLTATTDKKVTWVSFFARKGRCTQRIALDSKEPYQTKWTPQSSGCGTGTYKIYAVARKILGRFDIEVQTIEVRQVTTPPPEPAIIIANPSANYQTSADAYPPAPGTQAAQTFATQVLGPTTVDEKQYDLTVKVTGRKVSGGTFNLDYRIFDATTGSVLASGSLVDPTASTSGTITGSLTIPNSGDQHELRFQFKSSSLFSAVMLESYDITIQPRVAANARSDAQAELDQILDECPTGSC